MQLKVLSQADIRTAISMRDAIEAMRHAFSQLSAGRARVPLRVGLDSEHGTTLFMPAYLEDGSGMGCKIVSIFAGNAQRGLPAIHAVVLVLDGDTGVPTALMDGTYLTALRTAATAGLATELLSREDASVLAVFGAGPQARAQVEAMRVVRPIAEIRVVSRRRASAERFAAEIQGVDVRVSEDPGEAVDGADVVVAATNASTPVFDGRRLRSGAHVNGIGSYRPDMVEIDEEVVRRARIVVESREAALAEAGDLIVAIAGGVISERDVAVELGQIVNGDEPPGRAGRDITFFKSVGTAVQDVATAGVALAAAEERGLGTMVEL